MTLPKTNLHIHTIFSDGKNTIKRVVRKALKLDFEYIAITDHFTDSWKAGVINTLNTEEKITEYLKELSICQNYLKTNNYKLRLFNGIEIDLESSESYIKKLIEPQKYDIIIFEYLESLEGISFVKELINYWKKSGLISDSHPVFGLAHFDPSFFIHGALDELISFLKEYSIYFEFNSRYPEFMSQKNVTFFEKLKENNIQVAIGSDSHNLRRLDDFDNIFEILKYFNLENKLHYLVEAISKVKKKKK